MLIDYSDKQLPLMLNNENLEKLNRALFEFHVVKGEMRCPECERKYPIVNSIPNMLVLDEINKDI